MYQPTLSRQQADYSSHKPFITASFSISLPPIFIILIIKNLLVYKVIRTPRRHQAARSDQRLQVSPTFSCNREPSHCPSLESFKNSSTSFPGNDQRRKVNEGIISTISCHYPVFGVQSLRTSSCMKFSRLLLSSTFSPYFLHPRHILQFLNLIFPQAGSIIAQIFLLYNLNTARARHKPDGFRRK